MLLFSCSSTQKLEIYGKSGTEIYTPDMNKIATIPDSGVTCLEINKDKTYHFLLSHEKGDNIYVPFGLDFSKRYSEGLKFGKYVGIGFASVGTFVSSIYGTVFYLAGEESLGTTLWLSGLGVAAVGGAIGIPCAIISSWDQYNYKYKYLSEQHTNQDIVFTPLKQTAEYKTLDKSSQNISKSKANTERRRFSSGGSQSNKDQMSVITGTYSGKGELLDGSDVIEEYTDLSIVIKKKSENTVSVEVLASDGYSYFDEEMIYSVNRQDNQYVLKQKGSNSRIVIKNGNLSYTNHNINDGEAVFTLKITADK